MTLRRALSAVLALSGVVLVSTTQAFAHASLVKSDPAANSTVAPPKAITLTFNEEVTPRFSGFDVTNDAGMKTPVKIAVSKDRKSITGFPPASMMTGHYTVTWHAAAADDGHRTMGTVSFTVK